MQTADAKIQCTESKVRLAAPRTSDCRVWWWQQQETRTKHVGEQVTANHAATKPNKRRRKHDTKPLTISRRQTSGTRTQRFPSRRCCHAACPPQLGNNRWTPVRRTSTLNDGADVHPRPKLGCPVSSPPTSDPDSRPSVQYGRDDERQPADVDTGSTTGLAAVRSLSLGCRRRCRHITKDGDRCTR